MKANRKTKLFKVSTYFSSREINARNGDEAVSIFRSMLKTLVSDTDKITVS